MKTSLSTWAIRNPIPPIVLFLLLTVAGLIAYAELPVTNMPNVAVPVVTVQAAQPGAQPSEIEAQVTRKVEAALAAIPGVRHITSSIAEGVSTTTLEFSLDTDVDRAVNDTREAVSAVRSRLPASVEEPVVQRQQEAGDAILVYSVEAPEMSTEALSAFVDDTLARELLAIGGVARVARSGGADQAVTVTVDPQRMGALGVTAADLSQQLSRTNADLPGGRLTLSGREYSLRTMGSATTLDHLRELRIALPNGGQARLGDLATVVQGGDESRTVTRVDGRPAVTISIFRTTSANEVGVAQKVRARLAEIERQQAGVHFAPVSSLVTLTETGFKSTMLTLIEGVVLTLVVVFLFLRDRRATLITALSIPLSVIPTFLCMQWLGFTLNFVSVIGISLVTGALVDDAIVEIENIHRHMRAGKGPFEAAIAAAEEIGLAVIATTLVICAVFVPVSFMDGVPGLYFRQFGLTVAIAALFSLLVARLLTPMLAARLLRPQPEAAQRESATMRHYQRLVAWTLRHRLATLGIAALTVAGSVGLVPLLPGGFMPYMDLSASNLTIELPQGATLDETDATAQRVAAVLKARPEVLSVVTTAGREAGGVNRARVQAILVDPKQRKLSEREFGNAMRPVFERMADVRITFDNAGGSKDISIALVGEDAEALMRSAEAIEREMRTLPGLASVGTSARQQQPEITVAVDTVKAAQLGITAQQIGEAVNVSTVGDAAPRLAQFNDHGRLVPIRVRMPERSHDLGVLENLRLQTPSGTTVPLAAVASIRFGKGPTTIERYDRQRRINLEANLNGIALGTAVEQIHALPSMKSLPSSVRVMNTADAEFMESLMTSFLKALGGGLLLVYAIQVVLYKDWLQPLTRMAALPLSIGGAFAALYLSGAEFGLPAMIGIIMLMGISDKNSILLVDCILDHLRDGMPRNQAILLACRLRARPIVMTSVAMTAGMVPTALSLGLDPAFRAPMAMAVIGGLVTSTALSLVFMPVLFSYVRDFEDWLARKRRPAAPAAVATPVAAAAR